MSSPKISLPSEHSAVSAGEVRVNNRLAKTHSENPLIVRHSDIEVLRRPAGHPEIVRLQGLYTAEDWDQVSEFLPGHPALMLLLLEARPHPYHFPPP